MQYVFKAIYSILSHTSVLDLESSNVALWLHFEGDPHSPPEGKPTSVEIDSKSLRSSSAVERQQQP